MSSDLKTTRGRSAFYGALAVLIAGAAGLGTWRVIAGYETALEEARKPAAMVQVVAAKHDVEAGVVLSAEDLDLIWLPRAGLDGEQVYTDAAGLVGEITVERVLAGEPLRKERLASTNGIAVPESTLEEGSRAITVRLDRASGVGGFIHPGSIVDVLVTIRPDENELKANWVTETIIQAVRVIAVGDAMVGSAPDAKKDDTAKSRPRDIYATLEVVPEEAEKIAMATSRGDLYLSLRPRDDFELVANEAPLITNALVGIDARPAPAREIKVRKWRAQKAPAATAPVVGHEAEVITGSVSTVERFDLSGAPIHPEPKKTTKGK